MCFCYTNTMYHEMKRFRVTTKQFAVGCHVVVGLPLRLPFTGSLLRIPKTMLGILRHHMTGYAYTIPPSTSHLTGGVRMADVVTTVGYKTYLAF